MAQTVGKLNALKVSRSLDPGMYPDGAGLYLQVTGAGAKSWLYRYQRDGKEHQMGLDSLSAVSLADALRLPDVWRLADPRRRYSHGAKGSRADLENKNRNREPRDTALPHEGIPEFMAKLRQRGKSSTASALEFCILTASRTTETLGATAREIDLANAVWTIPAERMKMGVEHRIPLVGRALEIAKEAANGGLLFPGEGADGLDKNAMLELLMKMRIPATVHGFRSTFDDWASETTDHAPHIIDMALAHKIPDATKAAYRRGDLFTKRRALMADWDAYCSSARQDRA